MSRALLSEKEPFVDVVSNDQVSDAVFRFYSVSS